MKLRIKALVCVVTIAGCASFWSTLGHPAHHWLQFFVYLAAILLSSGMKVGLPKSEGTMSVNFPFILLGVLQLSPLQAITLAACSVFAQCRIKVIKPFTLVQIAFNVANVVTATALACHGYAFLRAMHIAMAPALALAATIYFFANTIPVALAIAWDLRAPAWPQWRNDFLWYLPFYLVGAILAAAASLIGSAFGWMTSLLLVPLVYTIYRSYNEQRAILRDREQHALDTGALHLRTIEGLAMAIEAKDQSTHRHLQRVRIYVSGIGKLMGLDASMMQALLTAAFLHDIGKLAVPEHIINKPGKLTPEEFEKMKIHPVVGADILERVRFPYPVVPIVRSHHEAWDGSGYPDGLKGEEIPLGARILTVVDCFDALASERPYRRAMPLEQALAVVQAGAGTQFDARIVDLLAENFVRLEEQARQQIDSMEALKTDMAIERGAAPAAGFEPEAEKPGDPDASVVDESAACQQHVSLNLVAAASQEAAAIFELSQTLGSSLSGRETSSMMCKRLQPLIPFDCFAVYLKQGSSLAMQFMDGEGARAFSAGPLAIGEGVSGWVAHSERTITNGNPTVEPHLLAGNAFYSERSSALSIPLFDFSGVVFGVLTVYSRRHAAFSKDHIRILQAVQAKFSLSLKNALRFGSPEDDTTIDSLTGLPNLRQFLKRVDAEVAHSATHGRQMGLVVCDLNSFKTVNDKHGHAAGDHLLREIAEAFRGCCDAGDMVARMGGDEFVFVFPAMNMLSAHHHLGRIEAAVERACAGVTLEGAVSSSIGAAFFPEDGGTVEQLLGTAERRLYLSKQTYCIGPLEKHKSVVPA